MPNDGEVLDVEEAAQERKGLPERLLYPIPEAAVLLGVSESTTWRRVDSGELVSVYDGGRRLVPRQALIDYAANLPRAETRRRTKATS